MFTGIIEKIAEVVALEKEGSNINFSLISSITNELKIDQSLSHNGVCLTVVDVSEGSYKVTAVKETLEKSNLALLELGSKVNIERSIILNKETFYCKRRPNCQKYSRYWNKIVTVPSN